MRTLPYGATSLVLSSVLVSGCGSWTPQKIENSHVDHITDSVAAITYDASRRGIFVVKLPAGGEVICAEPSPDVSINYSSGGALNVGGGATASGSLPNPVSGIAGAAIPAVSAITTTGLRGLLSSVKDEKGKPAVDLSKVSDGSLAQVAGTLNAKVGIKTSQSQTSHQLLISDVINLLRNAQFWACINQANNGKYDSKTFADHQQAIESAVSTLITLEYTSQFATDASLSANAQLQVAGKGSVVALTPSQALLQGTVGAARQALDDPLGLNRSKSANELERQAFENLFAGRLQEAQKDFSNTEQAFHGYHNAYELKRLFSEPGAVSKGKCWALDQIQQRGLSYGMTTQEIFQMNSILKSCTSKQ